MSNTKSDPETPGLTGAIAEIEKRNGVCREFVPGSNYHICHACGKARDEHLAAGISPEVTKFGALDMQVCVPAEWTDSQVINFTEREYPCGTSNGWFIRKEGSERLDGAPERNPCRSSSRRGFVHVMLEA